MKHYSTVYELEKDGVGVEEFSRTQAKNIVFRLLKAPQKITEFHRRQQWI